MNCTETLEILCDKVMFKRLIILINLQVTGIKDISRVFKILKSLANPYVPHIWKHNSVHSDTSLKHCHL